MRYAIVLALAVMPAFADEPAPAPVAQPPAVVVRPVPFAITPMMAIEAANANAPAAVSGVFDLHIRATGRQDGYLYLNTEDDYRDQRNLSVDIPLAVETKLTEKYGKLDTFFIGKHLQISGAARRVKIHFMSRGEPTEKYYYQTHVGVGQPWQIRIVDDNLPANAGKPPIVPLATGSSGPAPQPR